MPRSLRIQYPGAVYHVMSRGQRREAIFYGPDDYELFLETLSEACERTGWLVHAYVLMGNHHMILETPEPNLSEGMRWLQGTYATRYKLRHGLVGPVFQGRFKSPVIDAEDSDYFINACDYVHLNPVRAGLLPADSLDLADYPWSSYSAVSGARRSRPPWLEAEWLMGSLFREPDTASTRQKFRRYMRRRTQQVTQGAAAEMEQEWKQIRRCWCYGGESFLEQMVDLLDNSIGSKKRESYQGVEKRLHDERRAETLIKETLKIFKLKEHEIVAAKKTDLHKQALVWLLKSHTYMTNEWIANRLTMGSRTNIFSAVKRFQVSNEEDVKKVKTAIRKLNK